MVDNNETGAMKRMLAQAVDASPSKVIWDLLDGKIGGIFVWVLWSH